MAFLAPLSRADATALAGEILKAVPTVQSCTQERYESRRFADRAEVSLVTAIRRTRVRAALTALIIAQRLATVQIVDRIVVMEHGRIVETGTPEDLRIKSGFYARLARLQFDP